MNIRKLIIVSVLLMIAVLFNCSDPTNPSQDSTGDSTSEDTSGEGTDSVSSILDKSWTSVESIVDPSVAGDDSVNPEVAYSANGTAAAAWEVDGELWVNTFDGTAWGTSECLWGGAYGDYLGGYDIDISSSGEAVVVWSGELDSESYDTVWCRIFDGTGWSAAERLSVTGLSFPQAYSPDVAYSPSADEAIAVWKQNDDVYAAAYESGSWDTPVILNTDSLDSAWDPGIAYNGEHTAVAVWLQDTYSSSDYRDAYASFYTGSAWEAPESIEDGDNIDFEISLAADSSGNAVAVWEQYDGSRWNIGANTFDGSSWGDSAFICDDGSDIEGAVVDILPEGKAVALWKYYNSSSEPKICVNIFNGTNWTGKEEIGSADSFTDSPEVASDSSGNAAAVWDYENSDTGMREIYHSLYNGSLWSSESSVDTGSEAQTTGLCIEFNKSTDEALLLYSEEGEGVNGYMPIVYSLLK